MPKIKEVFMRVDWVEERIYPTAKWRPWENTVLYIPMKEDLLDHSWNGISVTSNSVSLSQVWWINVWYFGAANNACLSFTNPSNMSWSRTVVSRFKTTSSDNQWILTQWTEAASKWLHLWYSSSSRWAVIWFFNNDMDSNSTSWTDNNWHLITFTYNWWWESKIYLDSQVLKSWTLSWLNTWNNTWNIWKYLSWTVKFNGYMSEWILENKVRTAQEVADYYNKTKWNYWL